MNLLQHKRGRSILVFSLYLSEGAPIGFIWWAMPAILREMKVDIGQITSLTALLVLPWIFKFLWAPLVDTFRRVKNGFKTWIFFSQLCMGITLIPLIFFSPLTHLPLWIICLLLHSLAAATQDVAIDALVINSVATNERGMLNGYMQAGMLTGRSVFGGGALLLMHSWGMGPVMLLLIACILITMLLLFFVEEPAFKVPVAGFKNVLKNVGRSFLNKNTGLVLLFALTSAAAFEAAGGLAGPFLTDLNISKDKIGFFFFIPVVACTITGGLIGGWLSDKASRKKWLSIFLAGFVLFVMLLALLFHNNVSDSEIPYFIAFGGMYFFVGMFTASSYAFYMDQTDPKISATQFSTFMAATNGCESWSVWTAGKITGAGNYSLAFFVMGIISLLSLIFLYQVKNNSQTTKNLKNIIN